MSLGLLQSCISKEEVLVVIYRQVRPIRVTEIAEGSEEVVVLL